MSYNYKHVVKKVYPRPVLLLCLFFAVGSCFGQLPTHNLALWLRADSGVVSTGGAVSAWNDISGNNNNATQANGSYQPTIDTDVTLLNNKPTVKFNGTSQYLTGAPMAAFSPANQAGLCGENIFIVCNGDGAQTNEHGGIFTIGSQDTGMWVERYHLTPVPALSFLFINNIYSNSGNAYLAFGGMPAGGAFPYRLFEVRKVQNKSVQIDTNSVNPPNNSGQYTQTNMTESSNGGLQMCGTFNNGPFNLGLAPGLTSPDGYFGGEIAEILVYDTCLTPEEITQVETYLYNRYAPPAQFTPDTVFVTNTLCGARIGLGNNYTGYHWSTGATTDSITVTQSGIYSVSVTDIFHHSTSASVTVIYPDSLHSSVNLCEGGAVKLAPYLGSLANATFHWSSGQTTDSINVTTAGSYTLTVTDAGCTATLGPETVVVDTFDRTVSLGTATSLCTGNQITLVSPATGWGGLGFHWSNGSTRSFANVSTAGTYSVTVTDANSCSGSASVSVTITGVAPSVNFTGDTICFGTAFAPNNISTPTNLTYHWSFGDGPSDTSDLASPSHNYGAPGIYHVTLTAHSAGCTNDTTIAVAVDSVPVAAFQSGEVCPNNTLFTFRDLSTTTDSQTLTFWSWNFGDSSSALFDTSTFQNPIHSYPAAPDTYFVTLTVKQSNGCSASTTNPFIVEIAPAVPTAPVLSFPVNGSVAASDTVTFGWQSSVGADHYQLLVSTGPYPFLFQQDSFYNDIYTNQITVVLPPNQTYYWQVTAYNACGTPSYSVIDSFIQFSPADLFPNTLALWLKADNGVIANGNGAVTQWNDISVNHNNAVIPTTSPYYPNDTPMVIQQVPLLNHMPSLFFNGTDAVLQSISPTNLGSSSLSIFIVAKADGPLLGSGEPASLFTIGQLNTGMWIERHPNFGFTFINNYGTGGGASILKNAGAMPDAVSPYTLYGLEKNLGATVDEDINGGFVLSQGSAALAGPFTDDLYTIGQPAGTDPYSGNIPYGFLNGEIAEIIIFNTLLTPAQQTMVNNYLFNKYAPPVNLGPDIVQNYKLCPVTLQTGNRFVSYLWSDGSTASTLTVTQSGKYAVTTVDVFNRTSSDSINVTMPYSGTNPETDYVCYGDTGKIIQLIDNPALYHYQWFDSNSITHQVQNLNSDTFFIQRDSAGYYYAKISDNTGCSVITPKVPLIIDTFYRVQLLSATDTICKDGTLLINVVPYTIDTFLWQPMAFPGDTVSAPAIDSSATYYLRSVDNHGCVNYDSSQVHTRAQAPVANFTVPNLCLTNTTVFIDSSFAAPGDSIIRYYWNYGGGIPAMDTDTVATDGQTSYRINYGYGSYTVSLTVTTDSNCFDVKTRHITILPAPHAGFTDSANNSVYPYILCAGAGSSLQITDTSSAVGGSAIVQRIWKFDGAIDSDTDKSLQYSFPTQGVYTITLEVVNALGCADSITQGIDVNPPFEAKVSISDRCLGDYTTFTDLTQSFSIVSRSWNFRENGDGPYAYTQTAQFKYDQANTYDVELQIENAIGCISTLDTLVTIVAKPVATFGGLIGCQNHYYTPIVFPASIGTIDQWNWDIAGTLLSGPYPSILLPDTGQFDVSLKVTTQAGCVDSITQVIEVAPVPTALFSYTPLYGTAPLPVTFTNHSLNAISYIWNFGDGTSDTTFYPQINPAPYTYLQNGSYNAVLYAYNSYGCYDSLVRTIEVMPTNLCLSIEQVQSTVATQPDGSELVTLSVTMSNLGSRIITSAQLYAALGSAEVLEQNWTGNLLSGQTIINTFPAQFVVPAGYTNTYVCVSANNVNGGEAETNCGNTQECSSLTGSMQLAGPLPNPAGANCQLGIILPKAGTVYIALYDMLGQPVVTEFSMNLPAERTNYDIPVAQLQGGEYFIRIRYNDDTEVRNFVVAK